MAKRAIVVEMKFVVMVLNDAGAMIQLENPVRTIAEVDFGKTVAEIANELINPPPPDPTP